MGHAVASVTPRDQQKMGGMSAEMSFIDVTMVDGESIAMVVKTSAPGSDLKIAMGAAREALFYKDFATEFADAGVPRSVSQRPHRPHTHAHRLQVLLCRGEHGHR